MHEPYEPPYLPQVRRGGQNRVEHIRSRRGVLHSGGGGGVDVTIA